MPLNINALVLAAGIAIGAIAAPWLAPAPARAAGPAYEYHLETLNLFNPDGSLNAKAAEGWEVVNVYLNPANYPTAVLRRPKL